MLPIEIEKYISDETGVGLEVHYMEGDVEPRYWIRSGIAALQMTTEELCDLAELLSSYKNEEIDMKVSKPYYKAAATTLLVAIAALVIGVIAYV